MTLDEQIISMTTRVESVSQGQGVVSRGTGFFYTEESVGGSDYLVTNRHVVFIRPDSLAGPDQEIVPDYVEFRLRRRVSGPDGAERTDDHPVRLSRKELLERVRLHPNPRVDIVVIDIKDKLHEAYADHTLNERMGYYRLSSHYLPANNPVRVETASDVIVCSYPHGFYDTVNKYPIIKSGIIASSWGKPFEGDPCFLIDCQLFPGSSGGLVLSKPADIVPGPDYCRIPQVQRLCGKQFALLGIFSATCAKTMKDENGKTYNKELGLGIVWYGDLISQIAREGIEYKK